MKGRVSFEIAYRESGQVKADGKGKVEDGP